MSATFRGGPSRDKASGVQLLSLQTVCSKRHVMCQTYELRGESNLTVVPPVQCSVAQQARNMPGYVLEGEVSCFNVSTSRCPGQASLPLDTPWAAATRQQQSLREHSLLAPSLPVTVPAHRMNASLTTHGCRLPLGAPTGSLSGRRS